MARGYRMADGVKLTQGVAPKFVLGDDLDFSEWLIHLHEPRFACRIRENDFTPEEMEGIQWLWEFDGEAFGNFVWIDPQPNSETLEAILHDAADFVEAMSEEDDL